jgi:hypothetical protein
MIARPLALLGLVLLTVGCTVVSGSSSSSSDNVPRTRCLTQPQRSENYTSDRPLFYFLCAESP